MRKVAAVVAVVCLWVAASNAQQTYCLEPSPKTVVWGYYDAAPLRFDREANLADL